MFEDNGGSYATALCTTRQLPPCVYGQLEIGDDKWGTVKKAIDVGFTFLQRQEVFGESFLVFNHMHTHKAL